ncbi:FAD-dependent monooxygenase [Ferruginibacter sp. SUN106]|uniref:FAD-dependent monooxygenase n=1 Tax=Ferruginibacter sp. SUN106 TaxID=2978348 RepID=UPI003D36B48F
MTNITIIGGGIAGLTTAIALKNIGINAMVFEAAPEIKELGAGIGLGANAIKAFQLLGIDKEVINAGRFLPSFTLYNKKGRPVTTTDSVSVSKKYGLDNFTIHRADLHQLLLSKIDPACIQTNKRVRRITQNEDNCIIHFQDGTTYATDHIIAADGIHSPVRKQLLPGSKIRYAGYTCWRAVIDNTELQLNECSETWGNNGRFGIVPLNGNKIYWFACINTVANNTRMQQYKIDDLLEVFKDYHPPIPAILLQTKNENLIWSDIIDLQPIQQYAFNNVVLIGDAAHATTPNLGQGACQAIEDAVILADEIKNNTNIATAFKQFEKRRLKRTHWIVNRSKQIGAIAQVENKVLIAVRDFVFTHLPQTGKDKQFKKLYTTDF